MYKSFCGDVFFLFGCYIGVQYKNLLFRGTFCKFSQKNSLFFSEKRTKKTFHILMEDFSIPFFAKKQRVFLRNFNGILWKYINRYL